MSSVASTRRVFRGGPCNFESCSDNEDDAMVGTPNPHFLATPAGGHLATMELTCTRHVYKAVLHGIGSRTWNPRASKARPYHQTTAVSHTTRETCQLVQSTKEK
ncbi:hypothetical protein AVEN_37788-1 [Araneus ventricosus]|uniref:Uncharacterized protein n=1 Tax=Araneus ventricosus TaxID=182803 RepID=A0A4Y2QKT0_ARAVE|nr:hypothetical protein AVEN_242628-1 [Araneus ventricosus]GBN63912.1 hypothetical protein AVEN_37788-1 [Araneus ventricosus]